MANPEHVAKFKDGVETWNAWREQNPHLQPDLNGINLSGADLNSANLSWAKLICTNLSYTKLQMTNLRSADLTGALLEMASLVRSHCENAVFSNCNVYGLSVWDVNLTGAVQSNLVITLEDQHLIQVDSLQVAQFMHLLVNNQNVREVIDTVSTKVVLILGRFTPERLAVLEAIRAALRSRGRVPMLFDFDKPVSQTTDETISTLAHMSRFVIADITDAKSVLQELRSIVPNSPSVLVQPLLLASQEEPGMWDFFRKFPWVLEPVRYTDQDELIVAMNETVIAPAEAKALTAQSQATNSGQ